MTSIRLLHDGTWSRPPVLTAARQVLMAGLGTTCATAELGDMAGFLNGTSYDRSLVAPEGVPIIRIGNMSDPRSPYIRTRETFPDRFAVEPGDLLVSWSASFRTAIWAGPGGILNQHIFRVTEKPGSDRRYLRHAIEAAFEAIQAKVVGIGMMHLRRRDFLSHRVPAPDLAMQVAVADYLDWVESGAHAPAPQLPPALDRQGRIVERIDAVAARVADAARMQRESSAISRRLWTATARALVNSMREDRRVPVLPLGQVVQVRGGGTPSKSNPALWGGDVPWITPKDMKRREIVDALDHITAAATEASPARLILPGAVLVVVRGMILAHTVPSAVLRVAAAINQDMKALLPIAGVRPEYLCHVLWALNEELLDRVARSSHDTRKLETSRLLAIELPIPPLPHQDRVVAHLDRVESSIAALCRLQNEAALATNALLPSMLDRVILGDALLPPFLGQRVIPERESQP